MATQSDGSRVQIAPFAPSPLARLEALAAAITDLAAAAHAAGEYRTGDTEPYDTVCLRAQHAERRLRLMVGLPAPEPDRRGHDRRAIVTDRRRGSRRDG